jgi:hypothetical protein
MQSVRVQMHHISFGSYVLCQVLTAASTRWTSSIVLGRMLQEHCRDPLCPLAPKGILEQ